MRGGQPSWPRGGVRLTSPRRRCGPRRGATGAPVHGGPGPGRACARRRGAWLRRRCEQRRRRHGRRRRGHGRSPTGLGGTRREHGRGRLDAADAMHGLPWRKDDGEEVGGGADLGEFDGGAADFELGF